MFLTKSGVVTILDFGLAKPIASVAAAGADATMLSTGSVVGTAGYMAPEQVRGGDVDERTDIFALGALLYEMFTGRRAFEGSSPADTMSAVLPKQPPSPVVSGVWRTSPTSSRAASKSSRSSDSRRPRSLPPLGAVNRLLKNSMWRQNWECRVVEAKERNLAARLA